MPTATHMCDGIIFDLDGVLVDSRACVDAIWSAWSSMHDIPFSAVETLQAGRRGVDVVREVAPHLDAEAEAASLDAQELRLIHMLAPLPGAGELVRKLPAQRWAIATSAPERIARQRLALLGIPAPPVLVAAEMVTRGKPHPDVFLAAASALGVDPRRCAAFEDAPDGVIAAHDAGCFAIGVLTWARPDQLATDVLVRDLRDIDVTIDAGQIALHITPA